MTLAAVAGHGLYRARACAVRSLELVGLARAAAIGALAVVLVGGLHGRHGRRSGVARRRCVTFVALAADRGGFVAWLRRARTQGRYSRSIVVVGGEAEAARLVWLLRRHPELGLRPVGIVNDDGEHGAIDGVPWLGGPDTIAATLALVGANGVVIASGDLDGARRSTRWCGRCSPPVCTCSCRTVCGASTTSGCGRCRWRTSRSCTSSRRRCAGVSAR